MTPIAAAEIRSLYHEVDCRIAHGAESGGHLEYVRSRLGTLMQLADEEGQAWDALQLAVDALTRISQGGESGVDTATEVLLRILGRLP